MQIPALFTLNYIDLKEKDYADRFSMTVSYNDGEKFSYTSSEFTYENIHAIDPSLHSHGLDLRDEVYKIFQYGLSRLNLKIVNDINFRLAFSLSETNKKPEHITCLLEYINE